MHIFVALPTYSGKPCDAFGESLKASGALFDQRGWDTTIEVLVNDMYIQRARNKLFANFLKSKATHLFFLDDDLAWPADAMTKLIESSWPITCGAYPLKEEPEDYPIVIECDNGTPLGRDGWLSTVGAPAGFLCIRRDAAQLMANSYDHLGYEDMDRQGNLLGVCYDLFKQGVHERRWYGEDFGFCRLWKELGGSIWCWPDIDFRHIDRNTGKAYAGNYHQYLLHRPGGARADFPANWLAAQDAEAARLTQALGAA